MKILDVKTLAFPEIKVIRFARFFDHRGFFTETFRQSDFINNPQTEFMKSVEFVQCNESFSKQMTVRGLHFQWNPYMGKMVRTLSGHMVDLILDIRKGSPTFGKIIAYDMPASNEIAYNEWIWIPPGFAHGNFFIKDSFIEYFCSGEYNPNSEAGISPLAYDIDWALCDKELKILFDNIMTNTKLITDKDNNNFCIESWLNDKRSDNFLYGNL